MALNKNRRIIVAEILQQCEWFSNLPVALKADLLGNSYIVELNPGQCLLSPGDTNNVLYCVIAGAVGISSYLENGKEVLLTILEPVSWGGELGFFDGAPRTHAVYAVRPSHVLVIQSNYLLNALEESPILWKYLGQLITKKLRQALAYSEVMPSANGPAKVANRLLWLSNNNGEWKQKIRRLVDVQQDDLARLTFLSRTTVNQILQKFETDGVVRLHYGKIEIMDADKLKKLAVEQ